MIIELLQASAILGGPITMFLFTWWAFPSARERAVRERKAAMRDR